MKKEQTKTPLPSPDGMWTRRFHDNRDILEMLHSSGGEMLYQDMHEALLRRGESSWTAVMRVSALSPRFVQGSGAVHIADAGEEQDEPAASKMQQAAAMANNKNPLLKLTEAAYQMLEAETEKA